MNPEKAFILAAGLGTRLRPYTNDCPKPMVEVAGESLIQRIIKQLDNNGITDITVNLHYMADMLEQHLHHITSPHIHTIKEPQLLNTGGGIKAAIDTFEDTPFYVINGDSFCIDAPQKTALTRLSEYWDEDKMDILLLLQPVSSMSRTTGIGDYHLNTDRTCTRAPDKNGGYMFSSIRLNHPRIFKNTPNDAFSYLDLMDKAQEQGRLYGLVHDGEWHHISTGTDLENVNAQFSNKKTAIQQ